jgi:hypothetical protein
MTKVLVGILVLSGFVPLLGNPASASPATDADRGSSAWTIVNDNDPAVTYSSGVARVRPASVSREGYYWGDFHVSQTPGDWCVFSFFGTGVKWIGAKNVDHGDADIFIDGKYDTTIDARAPTWLKQQEIYTKTGLPDGPHVLKIVVKTASYQDFDAFAYSAAAARPAAMPKIEGVVLPPQMPYLNVPSRYPVGNGVVAAVCGPTGQWQQLCGPGYTTPNFINAENLFVDVDGVESPLRVEMKRAAQTGVFYGLASRGDLDICVIDYTCAGQPWISRLIIFKNTSATVSHTAVIRASIAPVTGHGYSHALVPDAAGHDCGFTIQADTGIGVPFGGNNTVDKAVIIAFNDPAGMAFMDGQAATIQAAPMHLAPQARAEVTLGHYFRGGHDLTDRAGLAAIRDLDSHANLAKSIAEWQAWMGNVTSGYSLDNVKDKRARELLEGALVILKTNVSQDGGVIAHTTFYKESYVRDSAMAIRGLLATGHTEEAKQWLIWIDHKLSIHGHLGDAMNCEASLSDKSYSFDMGNMDVEEPSWVLLCARDYDDETHDLATLKGLDRTLRYCMDVQLKEAIANNYKLEFNGDETEICGVVDLGSTGSKSGSNAQQHEWSLSSVAMAAASLDFYIQYVKLCGDDSANYHNAQTNTTMNLHTELMNLVSAMDRDFWRTDLPGLSGGFHDFFRKKSDGSWPKARLVNFTLMPVFIRTPYAADEKAKDVVAMAQLFDTNTGFLLLVPSANNGMEGHDLGYLLWGCIETGDWRKELVYQALVNGPTVDCWGSFSEAYDGAGHPNDHDLRSLETGVNVSALAKYWGLGSAPK